MLGEVICVLIPVAIFLGAIFAIRIFFDWSEKRWGKKEEKLRLKYPEFYQLMAKRDSAALRNKREDMRQIQKKIDAIIKELPYLPQENLSASQMELERLRKQYLEAKYAEKNEREKIKEFQKAMMEVYYRTPELMNFYKWTE